MPVFKPCRAGPAPRCIELRRRPRRAAHRAPSRSWSCPRSRAPPTRQRASPRLSGSRLLKRKSRAAVGLGWPGTSFSRYCTVKRMSTMFSSLREHRRVFQARRLRHRVAADLGRTQLRHVDGLVGLERVWEAGTGSRHRRCGCSGRTEVTTACCPSCTMKAPLPNQIRTIDARRSASRTDAGAAHVGLEVRSRRPGRRRRCHDLRSAAPEQATELAVEIAPELVEVGRAVAALPSAVAQAVYAQLDGRATRCWMSPRRRRTESSDLRLGQAEARMDVSSGCRRCEWHRWQ